MDEQSSRKIIRCSIRSMALFNQLVADLKENLNDDEFRYQRRIIGNIMAQITMELINPAVATFPDMHLNDQEQWRKAGALDEPQWLNSQSR